MTKETERPVGHWMTAKYPGKCGEDCGRRIEEGDRIVYIPGQKTALCSDCGPGWIGEDPDANTY